MEDLSVLSICICDVAILSKEVINLKVSFLHDLYDLLLGLC